MVPTPVALATPPPPGLQEAIKNSTESWQHNLEELFRLAKERFPDVVWELTKEDDDEQVLEEVWGHKAIVYARAPPSFQSRYFSFRPNLNPSPLPYSSSPTGTYPATSAVSLGMGLDVQPSTNSRTPSPFRPSSPMSSMPGAGTLLRLSTSINSALFSNELEYLYTGQGFGEAFEFLFDSNDSRDHHPGDNDDPDALRIDKLRKDLVFMWRSRLYSDVRIALTGNFSSNHENTTAIFSSHRFILVSRSPYFHTALLSWPSNKSSPANGGEPPTLNLPSPPFTPASLHFTLGFIYTGTLFFSHRTYDLSTAFAILRAALYLSLPTLHDEIQARIAQEMMHGLFHAFLPFSEYERLTASKWGTGGCRCRQCARRAPRVLEFALAEDVKNAPLERGARRALVGMFGEGWCTSEFAGLPVKLRETLLRGVGKRTTPINVFSLLFAAEHALVKIGAVIEPWADIVRDMIFNARKAMDELLAKEAEACFSVDDWSELMENEGERFEDGERVEWIMAAVLRGVKEPWAALLYQTLVSAILLKPHPTEQNAPLLSTTSHVRVQVEETRLTLLKWIGKRWIAIRQEQGFDPLEGWALKEISDHIEVPIDDLINPIPPSSPKLAKTKSKPVTSHFLRPTSNHPHTSRVDADSEASSMRGSLLTRNLPSKHGSARDNMSFANSLRSELSVDSKFSSSTAGKVPHGSGPSPARRVVNTTRAVQSPHTLDLKDRPDSKLTPKSPSIASRSTSPSQSLIEEEDAKPDHNQDPDNDNDEASSSDDDTATADRDSEYASLPGTTSETPPLKKTLITRASLSNAAARNKKVSGDTSIRPKSSASSIRSHASTVRKSSTTSVRLPPIQTTPNAKPRPGSRGSMRSNVDKKPSGSKSTLSTTPSRPTSRVSTNSSRPVSSVSTSETFRTAPSTTRSRKSSATSTVSLRTSTSSRTTTSSSSARTSTATSANYRASASSPSSQRTSTISTPSARTANASSTASSPINTRARKSSTASVKSVGSNVNTPAKNVVPPVPPLDPGKLTPGKPSSSRSTSLRSVNSNSSASSTTPAVKKSTAQRKTGENKDTNGSDKPDTEKARDLEDVVPETGDDVEIEIPAVSNVTDHKKSPSTNSTASVATVKRRGSSDTITLNKVTNNTQPGTETKGNRGGESTIRVTPPESLKKSGLPVNTTAPIDIPRGATLEIGIPCIISSKRKRFKAYARYIGEVEGERGPWVGVEVPIPVGENWMGDKEGAGAWEGRQWNDGTWGGIRYFEIGAAGSEWDYGTGDDRATRRRKLESGHGREKGLLKREGDQLSVGVERTKRIRSASPAVSEMSGSESRGLFVRPQQVLYVVDAVGADL